MKALVILLLSVLVFPLLQAAEAPIPSQAGSFDPSFQPGSGPDGLVRCILPLPDGRIIVGGDFFSWSGSPIQRLVRLQADGSIDTSFQPRLSFYWGGITGLWLHTDGKILVSGGFDMVSNKPRQRFGRLLADGDDDPTFGGFVDGEVNGVAIALDGSMFIVGGFKTVNGVPFPGVARLFANGQLDSTFQPPPDLTGAGAAVAALADGEVLVGGLSAPGASPPIYGLVRLRPNGQLELGYDLGSPSFFARRLEALSNGHIVVPWEFGVTLLMPDGGLDLASDLSAVTGSALALIRGLPDGRLLVGKDNLTGTDGGPTRLLRVFADGQVDPSFHADLAVTPDCLGVAADGTIYASSRSAGPNGELQYQFYRLQAYDSAAPPSIQWSAAQVSVPASAGVASVQILRDGNSTGGSSVQVSAHAGPGATVFMPFETTVEFSPGERAKAVAVPFMPSRLVVPEELISVELHGTWSASLGSNSVAILHVLQDQGSVEVRTPSLTDVEPAGGLVIDVDRQGALAYPVRWAWSVQGQGVEPAAWFTSISGTVLLRPGQTNSTVSLRLLDNAAVEGDKNFQLSLASLSDGFQFGQRDHCLIRILENDQPGAPGDGVDATVARLVVQTDGRTLLSGSFASVNGTKRNRLARLQPDGSLDDTFRPALLFPSDYDSLPVLKLATGAKVVVAGSFTNVGGLSRTILARLNPDGTVDPSFDAVPRLPRVPTDLAVSSDGSLVAIGDGADFNGARSGFSLGAIAKLQPDGRRDTNFSTTAFGGTSSKLLALPNGMFLAAGTVLVYSNALPAGRISPRPGVVNPVLRRGLARFASNGDLDPTFNVALRGEGGTRDSLGGGVADLAMQDDGRILIAGGFTNINSQPALGLARLLPDGSLDGSFHAEVERVSPNFTTVRSIAVARDGAIATVVEDWFFRVWLARFHPDGKLDESFGVHTASASSTPVAALPSGDILWAGNFFSVDGHPRYRLARFHSDGTLAPDGALALKSISRDGAGACQLRVESRLSGRLRLEKSLDLRSWTAVSDQDLQPGLGEHTLTPGRADAEFYRAVAR